MAYNINTVKLAIKTMQQLYDELMHGTRKFTVHEDGSETFIDLPPTSKELRAARAIAMLSHQIQQLQQEIQRLSAEKN